MNSTWINTAADYANVTDPSATPGISFPDNCVVLHELPPTYFWPGFIGGMGCGFLLAIYFIFIFAHLFTRNAGGSGGDNNRRQERIHNPGMYHHLINQPAPSYDEQANTPRRHS
jgi:hypothetical protein